jgi:hypothetical protein
MVSDPIEMFAAKYNAAWKPRAYFLDAKGVLRWCQPDIVLDTSLVAQLVAGRARR